MTEARTKAVVTGGANGIGAGICRRLARDGYAVMVLDLDLTGATALAAEIGGQAFRCDIADPASVRDAAAAIGAVDILVNNAAITFVEATLDASDAHLQAVVNVNLLGTLHCCRAFAPAMIAQGRGSIVNISSGSSHSASPGYNVYPATKSAIETLSRQLAMEWGPQGIRVNALGPGAIETEKNAANFQGDRMQSRRDRIPLRRTGLPADIADVVSALCSHDMRYVTGQILYVDGGITAGMPGI
jgi:3-oxoacyl-[acyl-carrier protein] reductase